MKFNISEKTAEMIAANILGTADDAGRDELAAWLAAGEENRAFYRRVADPANLHRFLDETSRYDAAQDWPRVREKREKQEKQEEKRMAGRRRGIVRRALPYAAAVVVAACIAGVFVAERRSALEDNAISMEAAGAIPPGSARAVLITDAGEVFDLDATESLRTDAFVHNGDVVDYAALEPSAVASLHTLRVPRGGEYRLVLSDGSRVWLNAESELKYPSVFTGGHREVEISGEAFFIVAADASHPFVVKSGDRTTTAVGTSFNVRTYDRYESTLLSGKVSVDAGGVAVLLEPGQQAVADAGALDVRQVNASDYVSWKDGRFVYRRLALREVMADMARWYDVDVTFADERTANILLTANIRRYEDLSAAIEIVRQAAWVNISVSGRTVHVERK